MSDREKLIELFVESAAMDYKDSAEYFIANGVTFQKWIPVTERLPDDFISVIIYIPSESPFPMVKEAYRAAGSWATKMQIFFDEEVTHWMPLPEPPKEVDK